MRSRCTSFGAVVILSFALASCEFNASGEKGKLSKNESSFGISSAGNSENKHSDLKSTNNSAAPDSTFQQSVAQVKAELKNTPQYQISKSDLNDLKDNSLLSDDEKKELDELIQ